MAIYRPGRLMVDQYAFVNKGPLKNLLIEIKYSLWPCGV